MRCPRKYFFGMVEHRRRSGPKSPALTYGTAWHSAMEAHYKSGGQEAVVDRAIVMAWQNHDNPDDHRTLDRCMSSYRQYLSRWGTHDEDSRNYGLTVGYPENPIVEVPTELWWPGAEHPYTGKIDRIFQHQGLYYVEDHKTTSQLGATYFKQFDPSNQMMGYAWLAQKLTGLPIAGVRINAHGVLKTQSKFERQTVMFSQDRLREWAENFNVWVRRINQSMIHLAQIDNPELDPTDLILEAFPHNFQACAGKYGMCEYTDVCTFPLQVRAKILEMEYDKKPWDPMEAEDAGAGE